MAVSLITSIPHTCYTSQLQVIELSASGNSVELSLYFQGVAAHGNDGRELIFQSTYATLRGKTTIYEIGEILENYMLETDGAQRFVIVFTSDSQTLELPLVVIYCKRMPHTSAEQLAASHIVTNYLNRIVYRKAKDILPFFADFGAASSIQIIYTIVFRNHQGITETRQISSETSIRSGISYLNTGYATVRQLFSQVLTSDDTILSYSLKVGNHTVRFYVAEQSVVRQFVFRNTYGCREYFCLPSSQTEISETQSSTAVCGDQMTLYDITHTRSFEEQTPVLQSAEMRRCAEFLTSHFTAVVLEGTEYPIVIKDYELKISDNPATGNAVKFQWMFASLRTPIFNDDYSRIFSTEFNETFA